MLFLKTPFAPAQLADFQKQSKLDAHSIVANPKFVNADKLDFRLAPIARANPCRGGPPARASGYKKKSRNAEAGSRGPATLSTKPSNLSP